MAFKNIVNIITKYPKFFFSTTLLVTAPIGNYGLKRRAYSELIRPTDDKLKKGTCPCVPAVVRKTMIPHQDISKRIHMMYFPNKDRVDGDFGVIIGPSGSGKTVAVKDLCEKHPKGVLYVEIVALHMFHKDLATSIGMRLVPTKIEDLILGYFSEEYRHHYKLSTNLEEAVDMVMCTL